MLLCTLRDRVSVLWFIILFIRVSKYSKASCKVKKTVNDWKNSLIGKIHLRTKSICIPLASIFTSYLPKGQFRLLSLKIIQT